MKLARLYSDVVCSESHAIAFLQNHGIFSKEMKCPACGNWMKLDLNRIRWRCYKAKCRKEISVRIDNSFFTFIERSGRLHSRLSLAKIIELVYLFLFFRLNIRQCAYVTGLHTHAVGDWNNLMREVCSNSLVNEPKMVGTLENPIQIDESFFSGRRKYNTGRLLHGNMQNNQHSMGDWHGNTMGDEDGTDPAKFGVDDPSAVWVLGIYANKNDVRYLRVKDRTMSTLTEAIEKHVEAGSVIVTDLWKGYNGLAPRGFIHFTVNHSENYVDPITGYHTQGVERSWRTTKSYIRNTIGNRKLFQSHLDEAAWKMKHGSDLGSLMSVFLDDIKTHYGLNA